MSSTDFVFICSDSSVFTENVIPIESIKTNTNGMNNLDSFGTSFLQPQQSPSFQSNENNQEYELVGIALQLSEDSSLHSSPTQSQPSSQSQHQDIIQHDEQVSDSELMTESVPISSTQSKRSPQQSLQEIMINEHETATLKPLIIFSKPITSKRNIRGKKFRTHKDIYLHYCNSGHKECKMIRNRKELLAHLRTYHGINLDQPYSLQSIPLTLDSETLSSQQQPKKSSLQSSSQYLVGECRIDDAMEKVDAEMESIESSMKRCTWNEVEKCWELMENCQIDGDEGNHEVGEECEDDENEVKDMDEDDQHGVDQLKGVEHESNIEGAVAPGDHRPNNMNTSLTTPQSSLELLNDQSAPTSSYPHNTIPIHLEKSLDEKGLNKHSVYSSLPVTSDQPNPPTHLQLSTPLSDCTMFPANSLRSQSASLSFNCDEPVSDGKIEVINDNQLLQSEIIEDNGLNGSNINEHQQQQLCQEPIVHQDTELAQSKQNGQVLIPDKSTGKNICEMCGKRCKTHYNLVIHIRTHTGKKPFICPWKDCHKEFVRKDAMQVHHMAHIVKLPANLTGPTRSRTKERLVLVCPRKDCGKTFVTKKGLKWHLESHDGQSETNKHLCNYCSKTFKISTHLTDHIRTHTGERPFKCSWKDCEKTFIQKSHLKTHFIKHFIQSNQWEIIPNGISNLVSDGAQSTEQQQQSPFSAQSHNSLDYSLI